MTKAAAVATVLALIAGFVAGFLVRDAGRDVAAPAQASAPPTPPARPVERGESPQFARIRRQRDEAVREVERVRVEREQPKQDAADVLAKRLNETLEPTTAAAVRDRADRLRRSMLAQADQADATAAQQVESEIRKERAERDDRMRGGTMAFLEGLRSKWTAPWELLRSPEKFGELFRRRTSAGVVDGTTLSYAVAPVDGTTIRFPSGRFALNVAAMNGWKPFPKDIAIEGAGMDATLLVSNNALRISEPVHSFILRDLTVDAADHPLEQNDGACTLFVERCRVVGFDCGAGGSDMLGGNVGAFYLKDSRIEAGFGRHADGNLFDVRGALLVRLENCDVVGPFNSVYYQWSGAAQVFAGCRFTSMTPRSKSMLERADTMAEFADCTFEYLPAGADEHPKTRPLSDLNPAWADAKKR